MKKKVAILGATGFAGAELTRILASHPLVDFSLYSRSYAGKNLSDIYPFFPTDPAFHLHSIDSLLKGKRPDLSFLALPHGVSMTLVPELLGKPHAVIDLSGDFRLKKASDYREWYGVTHVAKHYLSPFVYGLPELFRKKIQKTALVSNPGCYATATLLALYPALRSGWTQKSSPPVVDAKSGITGAGRREDFHYHYYSRDENFEPYNVCGHKHIPEIEQALARKVKFTTPIRFTPHLLPVQRGILVTAYLRLVRNVSDAEITRYYEKCYRGEPFIRVLQPGDDLPSLRDVRGTNRCLIALRVDRRTRTLCVMTAIDNLLKGAAGQAVQNMNLVFGFDETTALLDTPPV